MWRTIYLLKLPRLEKKVRVAFDWTLDLIFAKDLVQFLTLRSPTVSMTEEEMSSPKAARHLPNEAAKVGGVVAGDKFFEQSGVK